MLFIRVKRRGIVGSGRQGWGKTHCGQGIEDQDQTRSAGWIVWG